MKRFAAILGIGVLLAASPSFVDAQSTTVTSVNVVGFKTSSVDSNAFHLYALPFNVMGDSAIGAIFTNQLTAGGNPAAGDNVMFWDAATQQYIVNWKHAAGWVQGAQLSTQEVTLARAFWVKDNSLSGQSLTFSGEVVTNAVVSQSIMTGFNLLSYPFNTTVWVTNSALDAVAVAGTNPSNADNLMRWDDATQQYIAYWKHAAGWILGAQLATNLTISMGEGFWSLLL